MLSSRVHSCALGHTEITDESNTIQVPSIQVSEEPVATESSRQLDKVLLISPSVPRRSRHPALSITTHLFGSAATPINYLILSPYPLFLYRKMS